MSNTSPTLWHIGISHYSEKARWALAYKDVEHERRSPLPGMHMAVALWLTRGANKTFPVLRLDGRNIGDSTAIIAALEQRYPDPPLYPADPEQRRRALELEEFFDEELGPHIRLLVFHELINEPEIFAQIASETVPTPLPMPKSFTGAYGRIYTSLRFGAKSDAAAKSAKANVVAAMDRLGAELEAADGDYLVGDHFTVADLTAAALFYPLVGPEEGPLPPNQLTPPAFERFREGMSHRPGYAWVEEMYRRHRQPAGASSLRASALTRP